jgi:hypothetical protein
MRVKAEPVNTPARFALELRTSGAKFIFPSRSVFASEITVHSADAIECSRRRRGAAGLDSIA